MPLQFKNIAVGNLQDDVSGNNYAANKAVYILNLNNTLAQIFSDEAGITPIVQDGVNNVTNSKGVFGFWVDAGDYFVQVGANKYRVSITGADYFNNRIDETVDLIVDAVAGRGAYYPVGSFEAGFTYTDINQVGTFGGTDYYIYTGGLTNLPHPVPAGTNPTLSADYQQVTFNDHSALLNRHIVGAHDAQDIQTPSGVPLSGTINFASDQTLSGTIVLIDGKLRPASGVTLTIGSDCKIISNGEWRDTSAGGDFTIQSGAYEQKLYDKVTSPAGGYIVNFGWPGNIIDESSGSSFVFGGTDGSPHTLGASSQLSLIGAGYDNTISNDAIASTICGGAHHLIGVGASHSYIGGGSYLKSYADYATLGGGTANEVRCTYGFNGGGQSNIVGEVGSVAIDFRSAFNGAGAQNEVYGLRSANVGGFSNLIPSTGSEAFNGAGLNNSVSGPRAFNGAGNANVVSGNGAANLAGDTNEASGNSATTSGSSVKAVGNFSAAFGESLEATGSGSFATGRRCKASLFGQRAHASGYFSAKGDAQISDLVARTLTTGSQTKALDLFGGTSNPIVLPTNTTWIFKISLVARNIDNTENGAWIIEGSIKKDAVSGSTALVGTPVTNTINAPAAWSEGPYPLVSADTSNGSLKIEVSTGASVTDSIRWVARVELTEVGG